MKMHNPPHPGEILRELCIEPLGLSITEAAEALGVTRKTLSAILNPTFSTGGVSGPESRIKRSSEPKGLHYTGTGSGCRTSCPAAVILGGGCGGRVSLSRSRMSCWSLVGWV
jgi:Helix-turn-helix